MASLPNSKTVTYEEWVRIPEVTDAIEEVGNGEIRITPPAKLKHSLLVSRLDGMLKNQLDIDRICVLTGSFGLVIRKAPLTSREREEKLADYASIGVPEVWVVSPEARTVEVLHGENGFLNRAQVVAGGTLTPKLFPHLTVEIARIWPD